MTLKLKIQRQKVNIAYSNVGRAIFNENLMKYSILSFVSIQLYRFGQLSVTSIACENRLYNSYQSTTVINGLFDSLVICDLGKIIQLGSSTTPLNFRPINVGTVTPW